VREVVPDLEVFETEVLQTRRVPGLDRGPAYTVGGNPVAL
jgi:hypothetical protein